jgi:Flp pilus assembly CpaE family ATPase
VLPDVEPVLVVNQVRRGPVAGRPESEIAVVLERFAGRQVGTFMPVDRRGTDAALAEGRTLAEVAPTSPLRTGLRGLAAELTGADERTGARRRRLARRAG